jgi:hypothetical protein
MPNSRIALQVTLRASLVVMVALFAGHATLVSAQEGRNGAHPWPRRAHCHLISHAALLRLALVMFEQN